LQEIEKIVQEDHAQKVRNKQLEKPLQGNDNETLRSQN
jgi:hypothetical protein